MTEYLTLQERKAHQRKRITMWAIAALVLALSVFGVYKLSKSDQELKLISTGEVTQHTFGPDSAKVKIVEYADFQCSACRAFHPFIEKMKADFGDQVQFTYRYFPLKTIHANATSAAAAGEAAARQGKFWEMHDLLFQNQDKWATDPRAADIYASYAEQLKLDVEKFRGDMNSAEIKGIVEAGYLDATKQGLNSTPSIFINDQRINNPSSYEQFKQLIQNELNK